MAYMWELLLQAARDLTEAGRKPFSRQQLIERVHQLDPSYSPDSLNPTIQSMTDNLKGGNGSGLGHVSFHSVGRGKFELMGAGGGKPGYAHGPATTIPQATATFAPYPDGVWRPVSSSSHAAIASSLAEIPPGVASRRRWRCWAARVLGFAMHARHSVDSLIRPPGPAWARTVPTSPICQPGRATMACSTKRPGSTRGVLTRIVLTSC